MLKNLVIKNYALLEALEMEPSESLNIITGETGAGKSIMLGAIGLLLGNRADKKTLYNEDSKCVIEGTFTVNKYQLESIFDQEELDYDPVCILRREITPSGKSRAFINDTPVRLETMKGVGKFMVDIHSQHDSLLLANNIYQLEIIDAFADNENLLKIYQQSYYHHRRAQSEYEQLKQQATEMKREADYHEFLLKELHKAKLQAGEQDKLEDELRVMENAGNIKEQLNLLNTLLANDTHSVEDMLVQAKQSLAKISSFSHKYELLYQRLESCLIELRDINSEAEGEALEVDFDIDKVETVRERVNFIYQLQQKHQVDTVEELLEIQYELEHKLDKVLNLDQELQRLKSVKDAAYNEMMVHAENLSNSRQKVFHDFAETIAKLLKNLGIPDAHLKVARIQVPPSDSGVDEINILFSANKGIAPQEIKGVASGGEFSRLMFCIKYILADKISLPTIIFDEIDTGVSGEIAIKMVNMMKEMAKNHQVIAISHLPQVAAKGNAHYFVYKDNSSSKAVSKIKKLTQEERVQEIAKMIGGNNPSNIAFENAKELLT
ncbi:DNA repair protein RecN (Recombination protein N) [Catalinimonas alkaloidigena]|uniref:DNA repair protein RecN n=1 Tax=Catalinimonas alkaloidigena TaxID=1075417 RepID=UPI002406BF3D|nr:DNA repair protein RecN [Catalinimonas alkaloidigena]MDF9795582.1 DNA repair protein RecN (Recombination protein N) [Catalinimonas alkaloidigena]